MFDQNLLLKLRERYDKLDPLLFHRSVERAKTPGDLFDILDTVPEKFPLIWCEESRRWITTEDMYQSEHFNANAREIQEQRE